MGSDKKGLSWVFSPPKNAELTTKTFPKGFSSLPSCPFQAFPGVLQGFGEAVPALGFASQSLPVHHWSEILGKTYLAGVLLGLSFQPLLQGLQELQGMVSLWIFWMWWGHSQALQRGMDKCRQNSTNSQKNREKKRTAGAFPKP